MSNYFEKPYKILAKDGAFETLKFLELHGKVPPERLLSYLSRSTYFLKDIKQRINELENIGFIKKTVRDRTSRINYCLTKEGREAVSLVDVINGYPLSTILDRLAYLRNDRFNLLTHDITNHFIDELAFRRDFSEVFICTPWIRLLPESLNDLEHILNSAYKLTKIKPKIHIITRPLIKTTQKASHLIWNSQIRKTLLWFKKRGAEILCVPRLHSKLYIIFGKEFQIGIFGSENLTGSKNIELGIRIEDSTIVNKLYMYWEEIYNNSKCVELHEGDIVGKQN